MADRRMYASDIMNSVKKNNPTVTDISLVDKTKGTIWGTGIGLVGGLVYANFNNTNYATSALIGLIIGGVVSKVFI